MTPGEIHNIYKFSTAALSQGKLKTAFEKTSELAAEFQSPALTGELNSMHQSYTYMLQYFMEGANDPERKAILNKIYAGLFSLNARLRDELLTQNSSNYEFSRKRYFPSTPQYSNKEIIEGLNRKQKINDLGEIENATEENKNVVQLEFERVTTFIFNYFWLSSDYSEKMDIFHFVMSDDFDDSVAKSQFVTALTLNIWRTFDEQKLELLLDACESKNMFARQRALVGLSFVLAKYNRFIPFFPAIRSRLVLLADNDSVVENLQNIFIQIIATTETDEITRKLQEEIFPELVKLRPMMNEGMNLGNLNMEEWGEMNPEWEEILEKSGAGDKIKELADMQQEGADVYMSSFAMLKSYPFFNEFSNWFLPFDTNHSQVVSLFNENEKSMISTFLNSNIMCDSDRYSFCLSIQQMPVMQQNMMKQSFGEAAEQMEEMNKDEAMLAPKMLEKTISKHYIQGLFRFFKLFPQRADFSNMFSMSLLLHKSYLFDLLSIGENFKLNIAEYYFSKKLYPQALEVFEEIEKESESTAALYQKMGYSYQQTNQLFRALEAYKKADLLQPDHYWTLKKMAMVYRLTGNIEKAIDIYNHIDFIKPNQLSVSLQIAASLMDAGKPGEALKILLELNKNNEENIKVWRAIIYAALKVGNVSQAHYFSELLLEKPEAAANDFILGGHAAWSLHDIKKAIKHYKKAYSLLNNEEQLQTIIKSEKNILLENGITEEEIQLMLDGLFLKFEV